MMAVMALMMKTVLMMMLRQSHRNCAEVDGGGGGGKLSRNRLASVTGDDKQQSEKLRWKLYKKLLQAKGKPPWHQ